MSGLLCPHCGKMIDVFKTSGGMLTARAEGLRLLGSLPIEPEVIHQRDIGSISMLDNDQIAFTREFNRLVEGIIARDSKEAAFHS
jgi:ATP-binding protein involved in chromosome partitioning